MGTSITCSATAGTELRKNETTSSGCSTTCSTGTSRICSSSKMPLCCTIAPCGCTSTRGVGRVPGGSRVCPRRAWCSSRTSPSPALVTVFWPRKASFAMGPYEWCPIVARAIAIDIRSCRHHERSRRSRRLRAAPARSPWHSIATARDEKEKRSTHWCCQNLVCSCSEEVVMVVCVVQMMKNAPCLARVAPKMHLNGWQNTWEQAPGVPATPSPP